jgi:RHS repeat-associated protein
MLLAALVLAPVTSQARYLNPGTGRFQTMDSYEGEQNDPPSIHKYLYGADDPVNRVDPSGHDSVFEFAISFFMSSVLDSLPNLAPMAETKAKEEVDKTLKIVWAETGSIIPQVLPGKPSAWENWDSKSRDNLNEARTKIAEIANRGKKAMAPPKAPTSAELKVPFVQQQWNDCKKARQAAGNRTSNDSMVQWPSDDSGKTPSKSPERMQADWPYDYTPYISYGPFRVLARQKGDPVPVSDKVYIFFYNNVP